MLLCRDDVVLEYYDESFLGEVLETNNVTCLKFFFNWRIKKLIVSLFLWEIGSNGSQRLINLSSGLISRL